MALITLGSTISNASGSVGGVTYARNRGGAYVRNRTTPIQRNTTWQAAAKALFTAASNSWSQFLTAAQRVQWEAYAKAVPYVNSLGEKKYYTGQQRYVQSYVSVAVSGGSVASIATAPTIYVSAGTPATTAFVFTQGTTVAGSTVKLAAVTAPSDVLAGDKLLIYFGKPVSNAKVYFKGPYRYAGDTVYTTGATYPIVTLTDPYARTLAAAGLLCVKYRVLKADGRCSDETLTSYTIGAYAS